MKNLSFDRKLVFFMTFTFIAPFSYAFLRGYFPEGKGMLCFFIAAVLCFITHYFASFINNVVAKNSKKEFDNDKDFKYYIDKKKLFIDILFALLFAVIYFFVAFYMKKWYMNVTDHRTISDAKGYVYEIMHAILGFVIVMFDTVTWFLPEEIFMPNEPGIINLILPAICITIIPTVIFSSKISVCLIYLGIYCVLLYIRGVKRNRESKKSDN